MQVRYRAALRPEHFRAAKIAVSGNAAKLKLCNNQPLCDDKISFFFLFFHLIYAPIFYGGTAN